MSALVLKSEVIHVIEMPPRATLVLPLEGQYFFLVRKLWKLASSRGTQWCQQGKQIHKFLKTFIQPKCLYYK